MRQMLTNLLANVILKYPSLGRWNGSHYPHHRCGSETQKSNDLMIVTQQVGGRTVSWNLGLQSWISGLFPLHLLVKLLLEEWNLRAFLWSHMLSQGALDKWLLNCTLQLDHLRLQLLYPSCLETTKLGAKGRMACVIIICHSSSRFPFQYSCLENPMDGGAWQVSVHRVAKSQTRPKRLSSSSSSQLIFCPQSYNHLSSTHNLIPTEKYIYVLLSKGLTSF